MELKEILIKMAEIEEELDKIMEEKIDCIEQIDNDIYIIHYKDGSIEELNTNIN